MHIDPVNNQIPPPSEPDFEQALMDGLILDTLRQMQRHDEALKKAFKQHHH